MSKIEEGINHSGNNDTPANIEKWSTRKIQQMWKKAYYTEKAAWLGGATGGLVILTGGPFAATALLNDVRGGIGITGITALAEIGVASTIQGRAEKNRQRIERVMDRFGVSKPKHREFRPLADIFLSKQNPQGK